MCLKCIQTLLFLFVVKHLLMLLHPLHQLSMFYVHFQCELYLHYYFIGSTLDWQLVWKLENHCFNCLKEEFEENFILMEFLVNFAKILKDTFKCFTTLIHYELEWRVNPISLGHFQMNHLALLKLTFFSINYLAKSIVF